MDRRDAGLDRLLDLDGFLAEVGGGFWVKIVALTVPADDSRPHGVSYTLTLHRPDGHRVFGIDKPTLCASPRVRQAGGREYAIICIAASRSASMCTGTLRPCSTISGVKSKQF